MSVQVDFIQPGNGGGSVATGSVAQSLLSNSMNPAALRTNSTLLKDEWIAMDQTVTQVARERLVGVGDLLSAGLRYNLTNAMGTLVVQHQRASDMTAAELSMDGVTKTAGDRQTFDIVSTPVPIIHHDFQINARTLAASRSSGQPLDTSQIAEATRQVSELAETLLYNGSSSGSLLGFGSSQANLYGYTNYPQRSTVTKTADWAASSTTGANILTDVLAMISAAQTDLHFGPFILYVPTNWYMKLLEDFKAASDKSIMQRLLEIPQITAIKVADKMTDSNAVLVEMMSSSIDMVVGFEPMVVEWPTQGGLTTNFKVMSILVPRPKSDANNRSGIVHLS